MKKLGMGLKTVPSFSVISCRRDCIFLQIYWIKAAYNMQTP